MADSITPSDPWQALRRFTAARIALGHTGVSQPTSAQLDFQLAHARARDAVHQALDSASLAGRWRRPGRDRPRPVLHSAAENRNVYLQRPDLGRRLDAPSRALLAARRGGEGRYTTWRSSSPTACPRSPSPATPRPCCRRCMPGWRPRPGRWRPCPSSSRAAWRSATRSGELLGAQLVVVLIGERPGLSSPDSMGLYLTWAPRVGLTDERRNCISNIRPAGLGVEEAADKLHYLLTEARRRQLSGVGLKDETGEAQAVPNGGGPSFLL
jgi:ethanolamine ammonia-lyase small subunit